MTNYLFVYGTLMRAAADAPMGHRERRKLEAAGDWLGEAVIDGRLYDRGRYPILVAGAAPNETVHGEVFWLQAPAETFRWLDPYEGIPPGGLRGSEYERVVRRVQLDGGRAVDAWVYVHHGAIGTARPVPGGRWHPAGRKP